MVSETKVRFAICPVCVVVVATWLAMLCARFLGFAIDPVVLAVLLGASAVGITGEIERRQPAGRSPAVSKLILLAPGLVAAYGMAAEQWVLAGLAAALLALGAALRLRQASAAPSDEAAVRRLEAQMKRCC